MTVICDFSLRHHRGIFLKHATNTACDTIKGIRVKTKTYYYTKERQQKVDIVNYSIKTIEILRKKTCYRR